MDIEKKDGGKEAYRWAQSTRGTSSASLGAELGDRLLGEVRPLLRLLELLLRFAEFREIQSGDFLRFLDLPLVRLDLLLQLVDQILHALVILAIFVGLKSDDFV